ncbi:MAG: hypothetical protein QXO24_03070 [Candidatus Micrarchaeaceae archaeon]
MYKISGIIGEGQTAIMTKSIATNWGQEYLGQSGISEDYNFVPRENFLLIERSPEQALLSPSEMHAGPADKLVASPYEGPKSPSPWAVPEASNNPVAATSEIMNTGEAVEKAAPAEAKQAGQTRALYAQFPKFSELTTTTEAPAEIYSSVGIDPAITQAVLRTPTTAEQYAILSRSLGSTQSIVGSLTGITSTTKQSAGQTLYSSVGQSLRLSSASSLSNLISNAAITGSQSSTTTTRRQLTNNSTTIRNMLGQSAKTGITQKQTQKNAHQQQQKIFSSVGVPDIAAPHMNVAFPRFPSRIKQNKHKKVAAPKRNPLLFSYLPDVTSTLLGIHGKKKNRKFYKNVGLSRPIL